jgi:hypothetical protein
MTIKYIGIAAEYYAKNVVGKGAVSTFAYFEKSNAHGWVKYLEIHKEIPGVAESEKTRKPNPSLLNEVSEYFKDIDLYN